MDLKTITQVTKDFEITTRTLRYYEQIGLLESRRMEGYSYRVYNEETCQRIKQIIVLRKLRIPLKQIAVLLNNSDIMESTKLLIDNISKLDEEINSLSTIRDIISRFVDELNSKSDISLKADLLNDTELLSLLDPLSVAKTNMREESTMLDLNEANEKLNRLADREVRLVYLPPATVAAYQYIGEEPERQVNLVIDKFVRDNDLIHVKPDLRHYGFNAPCPKDETGYHGYEMWVTVPEDMDVPAPLIKKYFKGGLYAAYMIPFGAFEEWDRLNKWVQNSSIYEYRGDWKEENMFGWIEEHLNYVNHVMLENTEPEGLQLDLLIPIQEKNQ